MILLIEDNPGDIALFETALRDTAARCLVARDARSGIALLQRHAADIRVVVVDLHLCGSDGWSVLEHLRSAPPPRPEAIVFTSSPDQRDYARAGALGLRHYWLKPDDFRTLQRLVRDIAALDDAQVHGTAGTGTSDAAEHSA